ncbi:MAG: ATP-dependent 6-phosphofructokinase [Deltaproteobacteria bacterium]|nr:ATP-dependent 6-phosphofructokinase [Deltaproteobacteria bacterium]RLA88550.1 MAG: ATP-dependent 6-phosphofructokinase [Deltaproteobacteria bacterium]
MNNKKFNSFIEKLGEPRIPSPIVNGKFEKDTSRILWDISLKERKIKDKEDIISLEIAGPREMIYFDPKKVKAAIVTCGGLCPGINDVIRAIVLTLYYTYGVRNIVGVKYGLQGFIPKYGHEFVELSPDVVSGIHQLGGTVLGTSRGPQNIEEVVDCLEMTNIDMLFIIGGDGTLKAGEEIHQEIKRRDLKISIIGIPKTIDNDIALIARSFGFDTAVEKAAEVLRCAHVEATGAPNGIGLVKVMGRESGFIACNAALAHKDTNVVLIPEVEFDLYGPKGLFRYLKQRILDRSHAVIVVAEGAGQHFFKKRKKERDASGNIKLENIGIYLKEKIEQYFKRIRMPVNIKYFEPSYIIRSIPANSNDSIYCGFLGTNAVHAAMAGKTGMLVGEWNNVYIHLPFSSVVNKRKKVDINGKLWMSVLESTGQPSFKN